MTEKEELFLKWFNDNRESMHVNLSTVSGLRAAFFGGLEAAENLAYECPKCGTTLEKDGWCNQHGLPAKPRQ